MSILTIYRALRTIALSEFADVVVHARIISLPTGDPLKLRLDNAPHKRWRHVATFPSHFHDGSEDNVVESHISNAPEGAVREVLTFVRNKLLGRS